MTKREFSKGTFYYSLLQISTWSFYSILLSFSGNVLHALGFTDSRISLLLGSASLLALIAQLAIGELSGRYPRLRVSAILTGLGLVMLICALLMRFAPLPALAAAAAYGLCCVTVHLFPPLSNGLGMDAIRRGADTNYSLARGLGSLGYSIFAYITGMLVRSRGELVVPVMAAISACILLFSVFMYRRSTVDALPAATAGSEVKKPRRDSAFLRKYPRFALFLVGSVLLQIGHALINNFMFQIMQYKNGGADYQGIAAAVCALSELPVMFLFPLMLKKLRCDIWLRIAALGMSVKSLTTFLAPTPAAACAAQASQLIGYGLWAISSVNYAELLVDKGESVQAQSYLGASVTGGTLIGLYSGGVLCDLVGVGNMLLISLGFALAGGFTVLFTAQTTRAAQAR